jgi:uncharacterized protein (TIGR03067 family)
MKPGVVLRFVVGCLACGVCVGRAFAVAAPNSLPAELKNLQGTWNLVETDVEGQAVRPRVLTQWIFVGDKLYLKSGGRTVPQGVVQLDSSHQPKAIDLIVGGNRALSAIYEFKDHKLTICSAAGERPTAFVGVGGHVLNVLERVRAPHVAKHHR